jgi:FAD/FMN-containing dehydrogenase
MVANQQDVISAVNFARDHGLGVGVQATGHGITAPANGGVLVKTSRLKNVEIDPEARSARVGAGVKWADMLPEATRHGLAALSGSTTDVGVVGYTTGGGTGWFVRRYGFAADSVRSAEVVTADGRLLHASPAENSDLFWALRGGNSNFGIITSLEFSLYPVKEFYGGGIFYPIEKAREVLKAYSGWVKTLPDTLSSRVVILNTPPFRSSRSHCAAAG